MTAAGCHPDDGDHAQWAEDEAYVTGTDAHGDHTYQCDAEDDWCDESAMRRPGTWYCWILLVGCLAGCDQNNGGQQCEQVCIDGFNNCRGMASR